MNEVTKGDGFVRIDIGTNSVVVTLVNGMASVIAYDHTTRDVFCCEIMKDELKEEIK
jgi:hypothetical protein